jgi:integrase
MPSALTPRADLGVYIVSHRLGHASVTFALTVYTHVMSGDQKRAADRFAVLASGA